jgi:hypothetical protein
MKKIWVFLILLTLIVLPVSGCIGKQATAAAQLDQPFSIGIGQSARLADEGMVITFNAIISDNRMTMVEQTINLTCSTQCPQKINYIWDGAANTSLTIDFQGKNYSIVLKQGGLVAEAEDVFMFYKLKFNITPHRTDGMVISAKDYRLTLTVTKQNSLDGA